MNTKQAANDLRIIAERRGLLTALAPFGGNLNLHIPLTQSLCGCSIDELNLPVRAYNGLRRAGAYTIGNVAEIIMSQGGLFGIRNLGKKSVMTIQTSVLLKAYEYLSQSQRNEFWQDFLEHLA